LSHKRSSIDEPNRSLKKIKIIEEQFIKSDISLNNTFNENVIFPTIVNQQSIPINNKEESTLKIDEIGSSFNSSDDPNPISSPKTNKIQQDNFKNELPSQVSNDKLDEPPEKTLNIPIDHQSMIPIPSILSNITKSSCVSSSITNESLNLFDSRSITTHKHLSHHFPQIPTPDHNLFTSHHQHFPYPFFAPPPPGNINLSTTKTKRKSYFLN